MDAPEIFSRQLRRKRRDRAADSFAEHDFLVELMVEELMARLDAVKRDFARALILGCFDGRIGPLLRARGIATVEADAGRAFAIDVQCDEDRLPFADGAFDLVVSVGVLDTVNDLPGAFTLIRRVLRPDGLFLAAFVAAGSLPRLREAAIAADSAAGGGVPPRIHPQIDVRSAGDLLARAGFALPVADSERLTVRYGNALRLASDLRGMAAGNLLSGQRPPFFSRSRLAALCQAFAGAAEPDGRTAETFEIVHLVGWSPDASQPKPARRGSATQSLADALKRQSK
jgi:SAM-dependent methyltransferase